MADAQARTIYLVDGTSNLFRAYFAIRGGMTSADGLPTNAIFGFTQILRRLVADESPEFVAVAFDTAEPTFRHLKFDQYKAQRPEPPEDLVPQFPFAPRVCRALGIPALELPGFEADDILGTLATKARAAGFEAVIVASDKDLMQIVGDGIRMMLPHKDNLVLDAAGVKEYFGVRPEQVADVLALWGDASDNIPGVSGIGEKGAKQIIDQFGDLETAIARANEISRRSYRDNLIAEAEQARFSRELATIARDAPIAFDPEKLRRQPPDRPAAYALFQQLGFQSLLSSYVPEAAESPAVYRAILADEELAALARDLARAGRFAVDTETTSIDPLRGELVGISFAWEAGCATYLPLAHRYLGAPAQIPVARAREVLGPLLADPALAKVGQNIKYDVLSLGRAGFDLQGIDFDTMIASYLIDPDARHNMDDLALKHLGHRTIHYEDVAGKGAKQVTLDQVEVEKVRDYAAEDAEVTWRLYEALGTKLAEAGQERLFRELEMPLLPVLTRMERAGVRIDAEYLRGISREFQTELDRLEGEIHALAGTAFNIHSPAQLGEVLFDRLGLTSTRKTQKTRSRSTGQDALEELAAEHDLPRRVLDYRSISKLKSTYVDTLPALVHPETGRVHTSFNQTVAATGRLSSTDPNLQNIPVRTEQGRRIRRAFIPADGCLLLTADYSQVELRILAHLSGDPELLAAFRHGEDIHRATAARIFGVAATAVTSEMRSRAKAVNFGILYGMSASRLAREEGMTRADAQKFIDGYFGHFGRIQEYIERTTSEAGNAGRVTTLFGRVRYLPDIKNANPMLRQAAARAAVNTTIQGTAADLIKKAMLEVDRRLAAERLGSRMLLQVHDELVLEVPERELEAARRLVVESMEGAYPLAAPLVVDTGAGRNWVDAKA